MTFHFRFVCFCFVWAFSNHRRYIFWWFCFEDRNQGFKTSLGLSVGRIARSRQYPLFKSPPQNPSPPPTHTHTGFYSCVKSLNHSACSPFHLSGRQLPPIWDAFSNLSPPPVHLSLAVCVCLCCPRKSCGLQVSSTFVSICFIIFV